MWRRIRRFLSPQPVFELGLLSRKPTRGSVGSAGLDLYANEAIEIPPGSTALVSTGLRCRFNYGWVALIWDRSGMGVKGIHRFAGVIDSDYDDKWGVVIHNTQQTSIVINIGDRIAQVLFQRVWMGTPSLGTYVGRGRGGGFGSTGR